MAKTLDLSLFLISISHRFDQTYLLESLLRPK